MRRQLERLVLLALMLASGAAGAGNAVQQGGAVGPFAACYFASGSPNVNVADVPIVRVGDPIECVPGIVCPDGTSPVAGTVSVGSSTVRVNGVPAAVTGLSVVRGTCIGDFDVNAGWPFVNIAR